MNIKSIHISKNVAYLTVIDKYVADIVGTIDFLSATFKLADY